jgi:ABC-type glycerol-3-phosphate transport system substrate-binding protein
MQNVQPSAVGYSPAEIADLYSKAVQSIVIGDKEPADAVTELDAKRTELQELQAN